jgi:hypothetical protein
MLVNMWATALILADVPLRNPLACEMSQHLNQLSIAEHGKSAIALAESYLVRRAWVLAWLALCGTLATVYHKIVEISIPSARVYTGGLDSEGYCGASARVLHLTQNVSLSAYHCGSLAQEN